MARQLHFHDGAAWRRARALWVHDGAAWRKARAVFVHDGSAWRQSAASQPVDFSGSASDYVIGANAANCSITFCSDGRITFTGSQSDAGSTWYDAPVPGIGASHWIRGTRTDALPPNFGDAVGAWLPLSADRAWTYATTGTGGMSVRNGAMRFEISSDADGSVIVCSGMVNFSAVRET